MFLSFSNVLSVRKYVAKKKEKVMASYGETSGFTELVFQGIGPCKWRKVQPVEYDAGGLDTNNKGETGGSMSEDSGGSSK
jgi:hypothetical protein